MTNGVDLRKVDVVAIENGPCTGVVALFEGLMIGHGSIASKCRGWIKPVKGTELRERAIENTHFKFFKDGAPGHYIGKVKQISPLAYVFYEDCVNLIPSNERIQVINAGLEGMAKFREGHSSLRDILDPAYLQLNRLKHKIGEIDAEKLKKAREMCEGPKSYSLGILKKCLEVEGGYQGFRDILKRIVCHVPTFGITTATSPEELQKIMDLRELMTRDFLPLTEKYDGMLAETSLAEFYT